MNTPKYLSYLLRLWQVSDGEQFIWRASLESARNGKKDHFADIEALVAYLQKNTLTGDGANELENKGVK
jgi:hypothetical protein